MWARNNLASIMQGPDSNMSKNFSTFCPNRDCKLFKNGSQIVKIGFSRPIASIGGGTRQRYQCLCCKKRFSENSESLYFRSKKTDPALYSKIFALFVEGLSNRRIARFLGISPNCVSLRLEKLTKHGLAFHISRIKDLNIREAICIDGLENFAGSQFEPNNINQAIGQNSLFVYDFNFAPLNRKGRMSGWQKGWLKNTETYLGSFPKYAVQESFSDLVKRLHSMAPEGCIDLITDQHYQYRRAIKNELKPLLINHLTISSKAHRDYKNILFPVNHLDLFIRERIAAFRRETISFSKKPGKMMQKYILYILYKNYMCEQFTKKLKSRPTVHLESPAQALGIADKLLSFAEVFNHHARENPESWPKDWKCFYHAKIPSQYLRSTKNTPTTKKYPLSGSQLKGGW